jgi:hypothetical protein
MRHQTYINKQATGLKPSTSFFTQEKANCVFGADTRLAALISQSSIMQEWLRIELWILLGFTAIKK